MDNIQMWVYILFSAGAGIGLVLVMWLSRSKENIQTEQPKEYVPDSPVKELFDLLVLKGDILENYQFNYNGNIYSINSNTSGWWCDNSDKHELTWLTAKESNWLFSQIIRYTKQRQRQAKAKQREQVAKDVQEQLANTPYQCFQTNLYRLNRMLFKGEINWQEYNRFCNKIYEMYRADRSYQAPLTELYRA